MRIVTIGGYGFTEDAFINALKGAGVDAFVDIRQRRGMRGSKYAFLNSATPKPAGKSRHSVRS